MSVSVFFAFLVFRLSGSNGMLPQYGSCSWCQGSQWWAGLLSVLMTCAGVALSQYQPEYSKPKQIDIWVSSKEYFSFYGRLPLPHLLNVFWAYVDFLLSTSKLALLGSLGRVRRTGLISYGGGSVQPADRWGSTLSGSIRRPVCKVRRLLGVDVSIMTDRPFIRAILVTVFLLGGFKRSSYLGFESV